MISCIWYYVGFGGSYPKSYQKVVERITARNIKRLEKLKQTNY